MSDAEVYDAHRDDLIRYATALVGPDAAQDVVAAVVLRALARAPLAEIDEPRPYLFRAVLNEARGMARRRHFPGTLLPADAVTEDAPNLHPDVLGAVARLPVRQRAATYLVYWVGCSMSEAAMLMGVGEGTVKRYVHLARHSLKEVLGAYA